MNVLNNSADLPFVLFDAGNREYKLKFSAYASIRLEKKLGCSLLEGFKRFNEVGIATLYLWAAMHMFQPDADESDGLRIYDDFINDGGTLDGLANIMLNVLKVSGFLKKELFKTEYNGEENFNELKKTK